jgi:hypothetical protein
MTALIFLVGFALACGAGDGRVQQAARRISF